jgi:shikimate dehydrogenase
VDGGSGADGRGPSAGAGACDDGAVEVGQRTAPIAAPVRALLLAYPAGHSLSPVMHDAAFAALGMAGRYLAWEVAPRDLALAVERIRRDPDLLGANVTVPHKEAVADLLDDLTPRATRLAAVNTIRREGERLIGDNTDAPGFAAALAETGAALAGIEALVLGAGGAARAVVAALLEAGASVLVHNRTPARAEALAGAWRDQGRVDAVSSSDLPGAVARCRLLVNTTTVGMSGGPSGSPLPAGVLPRRAVVVDLVYRPRETPLLAAARAAGLTVQDGVPMLVHQGALAFEAWTGRRPPVSVMRRAVERALGP